MEIPAWNNKGIIAVSIKRMPFIIYRPPKYPSTKVSLFANPMIISGAMVAMGNVPDTAFSEGVKHIISTMEKLGVNRFIQVATPSSADPNDKRDLVFGFMVALIKRTMPGAYGEIVAIGEAVRLSTLDWTIVRVPLLNDKPVTRRVRAGYLGQKQVKTSLSRADLAWLMLEQVSRTEFVQKAPAISN